MKQIWEMMSFPREIPGKNFFVSFPEKSIPFFIK